MASQWPPRSPFEALLSSPSGRKRMRDLRDRGSVSPSPTKRARLGPVDTNIDGVLEGSGGSDEDEETLQLRLEAIQAKLKLKKLRQAKAKSRSQDTDAIATEKSSKDQVRGMEVVRAEQRHIGDSASTVRSTRSQQLIQVPLSPPERKKIAQEVKSPGRVRLGIDKGLTGKDVSLRRPPNSKTEGRLSPGTSRRLGQTAPRLMSQQRNISDDMPPPKSFSERIAEIRAADRSRQEREERLRRTRSKGFGIAKEELEAAKEAALAVEQNDEDDDEDPFMVEARRCAPREFTRAEVLQSYNQPEGQSLKRRATEPDLKDAANTKVAATAADVKPSRPPSSGINDSDKTMPQDLHSQSRPSSNNGPSDSSASFEPFSGLHLSKRILAHNLLTREFVDKKTFHIPDLLKTIKSPSYDPPDIEDDWVVLGIIASKSTPRDHKDERKTANDKQKSNNNARGKYMVLTLTDLKWELELFLFSSAFDRFWKLTPGTVIAILNPSIMPPPQHKRDTGRFSLTLGSSEDTVLEIGTARDLGFCKSVKRDGNSCGQWVDKRHTEYCAFHVDASVRKTRAGRMEVNTMTAPFGPGGRSQPRFGGGGGGGVGGSGSGNGRRGFRTWPSRDDHNNKKQGDSESNGLKREGPEYDRGTHSQVYITPAVPGFGRTSASLLDDEDVDPDAFHRGYSKQERLRRQLAAQEREREIARKLGEGGNGMGGTYLRMAAQSRSSTTASDPTALRPDATGHQIRRSPERDPSRGTAASNNDDDIATAHFSRDGNAIGTAAAAAGVGTEDAHSIAISRGKAATVSLSPLKGRLRQLNAKVSSLGSSSSHTVPSARNPLLARKLRRPEKEDEEDDGLDIV